MGELLIILGIIIALILWFRHQRQREHEKFMNDDMSAIQTLDSTPESSGRKPIDVINGGHGLRTWVDDPNQDFDVFDAQLNEAEKRWQEERQPFLQYPC